MRSKTGAAAAIGLAAMTWACTGPTAPTETTTTTAARTTIAGAPTPSAADGEQTYPVMHHVRDYCPPHGPLTSGANGGHDAFPLTLTFTGPRTFTTQSSSGDYVEALEAGHWKVKSVTTPATTGQSGYQATEVEYDVPQQLDITILQFRECGGAPPPPPPPPPPPVPPPPPPPQPPPPVPPPPVPPPPPPGPVCVPTSSAAAPHFTMTDPRVPLQGGVDVRGADEWTVEIHGRPDSSSGGYFAIKTSTEYVTTCTEARWLPISYAWNDNNGTGLPHPWHDFRVAVHNRSRTIDLVGQWVTK